MCGAYTIMLKTQTILKAGNSSSSNPGNQVFKDVTHVRLVKLPSSQEIKMCISLAVMFRIGNYFQIKVEITQMYE